MPRYTGEEIKDSWNISPRAAKKQAEKALPQIEAEISKLIGERQICEDILQRPMTEPAPEGPSEIDTHRDEPEEGGAGSLAKEPEEAPA